MSLMSTRLGLGIMMTPLVAALNCGGDGKSASTDGSDAAAGSGGTGGAVGTAGSGGSGLMAGSGGSAGMGGLDAGLDAAGAAGMTGIGGMAGMAGAPMTGGAGGVSATGGSAGMGAADAAAGAAGMGGVVTDAGLDTGIPGTVTESYKFTLIYNSGTDAAPTLDLLVATNPNAGQYVQLLFASDDPCQLVGGTFKHNLGESTIDISAGQFINVCDPMFTLPMKGSILEGVDLNMEEVIVDAATRKAYRVTSCGGLNCLDGQLEETTQ